MQVKMSSVLKKNIIKNNIKILSLSTILLFLNSGHLSAQTITTPIVVNGTNRPLNNEDININAVDKEAIKVGNGTLEIRNSHVTLESNKDTVKLTKDANVLLQSAPGKKASIISTSVTGRAINASGKTTLNIDGFNIIANGTDKSGIGATAVVISGSYNDQNAYFDLNNSQINTANLRGISVANSVFNANNFQITTGRDEATGEISSKKNLYGINASNQNQITLTNGTIETHTANSVGLNFVMDNLDTSIERARVTNINIVTHGSNATGIDNINTRASITGGSITTNGIGGHGIGASNGGVNGWASSVVAVNGTKITTNGDKAYGLVATTASSIDAKGVNITTSGASGVGAYSQSTGRINISDNSSITTSGEGAHAVAAMLGTEVNITDTVISTSGTGAAGIYMAGNHFKDPDTRSGVPGATKVSASQVIDPDDNSSNWRKGWDSTADEIIDVQDESDRAAGSQSSSINLTRSTLDIANGAALRILGGEHNTITIANSTIRANQGENALLISSDIYNAKHEVGVAEIRASASQLSGDVLVNSGEVNLDLSSHSYWSGTARLGTDDRVLNSLTLDNTSGWLITGNSTVNTLASTGAIAFYPSNSDFKTLTVQSDFTSSGGNFAINTKLGDDNSETDKIIFEGDVTGNNQLLVRNAGGLGAQTTEGIKVVEVNGASDGQFSLTSLYRHKGKNTVVAGAYTYKLYQGGITDPNDGDWYLRSDYDNGGYQAGVPVYEIYPQFLLGLNTLPTMQQRVGNRYWNNAGNLMISQGADAIERYAPTEEAGSFTQNNGVWGRMEGSHTKMEPQTSTSGATYDYDTFKMQAGIDAMLHEGEQGKLIGGITAHYVHGAANVWADSDSDLGRGRIKTDGYGIGATLTWYGDNNLYWDNQAQVTWYRTDLTYQGGQSSLTDGKNDGFGYGFSSELGKRFALNDRWSLTPQAQLTYSNVDFDSFTDVFEATVSREKADSLQARLGISADYQNSWRNAQGGINRSAVYGIANLYNEFLNGTRVDVSSVEFTNKSERLWAGVGLGGSYNWNDDKYSVYGEGSVNTGLKNFGDSYTYKGTAGFRVKW